MSRIVKQEDETGQESDDNLEVMRSSSGPLQTYRPHKRAHPSENGQPVKQPRLQSDDEGSDSEEPSGDMDQESSDSEPEIEEIENIISDDDEDDERAQNRIIDPEIVVISDDSEEEEEDDDSVIEPLIISTGSTHVVIHEIEPLPSMRDFAEFMRQIAGVNIEGVFPEPLHGFRRTRLTPQQREMWLRQQVDAETRRRNATSDPARYIPFVAEALGPRDTNQGALYRIHIGPPVMQTIQTQLPPNLQEMGILTDEDSKSKENLDVKVAASSSSELLVADKIKSGLENGICNHDLIKCDQGKSNQNKSDCYMNQTKFNQKIKSDQNKSNFGQVKTNRDQEMNTFDQDETKIDQDKICDQAKINQDQKIMYDPNKTKLEDKSDCDEHKVKHDLDKSDCDLDKSDCEQEIEYDPDKTKLYQDTDLDKNNDPEKVKLYQVKSDCDEHKVKYALDKSDCDPETKYDADKVKFDQNKSDCDEHNVKYDLDKSNDLEEDKLDQNKNDCDEYKVKYNLDINNCDLKTKYDLDKTNFDQNKSDCDGLKVKYDQDKSDYDPETKYDQNKSDYDEHKIKSDCKDDCDQTKSNHNPNETKCNQDKSECGQDKKNANRENSKSEELQHQLDEEQLESNSKIKGQLDGRRPSVIVEQSDEIEAGTVIATMNHSSTTNINSNTAAEQQQQSTDTPSAFENTNTAIEMILVNAQHETVVVNSNNSVLVPVPVPVSVTQDNDTRLPDVVVETKLFEPDIQAKETYFSIAIQVFIPFLIAGFGMVGAGLVLDLVQHWSVFEEITELVILVPALLGLKGNLEMTLASRLSTQANLGHMETSKQQWSLIVGNLTLIQCQAIVVGFLGSVIAIVMGGIKSNDVELDHAYLLCASSLVTVSLASFVLGLITAGVIILSRHCHINPDNVATPIAASLGDITSLALLSWIATVLYESIGTQDWLAPVIIGGYILVIPLWIWIAKKNQHTRDVLYNGWTPVMAAMLISSMGGLILDFMVSRFEGIAVFQPVINGVGGNLVAVQASRISTALHKSGELGILASDSETDEDTVIFISPVTGFCGKGTHAKTTRVLMAMVVPGHLIFIYTINYMKAGHTNLTTLFVIVYLFAATLQVAALMYIAYIMIHWMWKKKIDPDNSAIPYLTSMGDLLGISLLAIAFQFLYLVGDHESDEMSGV